MTGIVLALRHISVNIRHRASCRLVLCMYTSSRNLQEARQVFGEVLEPDKFVWASMIAVHVENREPELAVKLYRQMLSCKVNPTDHIFVPVLKACASLRDLKCGRLVHADAVHCMCVSSLFVSNTLIDMYAKCGSVHDARAVFDSLATKNVVTWNAMITGYVQHGLGQQALHVYQCMQRDGITPDRVTFLSILKACGKERSLQTGKEIHAQILESGWGEDLFLANTMVHMYAKCGSLKDANKVFHMLPFKDVVTWNAMIEGYTQNSFYKEALNSYDIMQQEGVVPDRVTFVCILKACSRMRAIHKGKEIHIQILERGLETDAAVGNTLVDMYVKCRSLEDAHQLFDRLRTKNVVTWNAMIAGYARNGLGAEALSLYATMGRDGLTCADAITFVCLLKACASIGASLKGKELHAQILERGLEADGVICNTLLYMYATCGSLEDACRLFDRLPAKDVVSWNALIQGYVECGLGEAAFYLYDRMRQNGTAPNRVTYMCLLKDCIETEAVQKSKEIHVHILESGMEADSFVANTLVDMYSKFGMLNDSRTLFDRLLVRDVVTWNAMIEGYAQHGLGQEALNLYDRMQQDRFVPDRVTFIASLKACATVGILQKGRELHVQILEAGEESDEFVGNSLVDMYAKCGSPEFARTVFDRLSIRTRVTWNAMIEAFAHNGRGGEALQIFEQMLRSEVSPDKVTYVSVLKACGCTGAIQTGKRIHSCIVDQGLEGDVFLTSSLVDMYAKCGALADALLVLNESPSRDVVAWTALMNGYSKQNRPQRAIQCFEDMLRHGVEPNGATFTSLLVACSHGCLVDEGQRYFQLMVDDYGINPTLELCNCVVDLLARSGHLDAAEHMLRVMPFQQNVAGWMSLLSGCRDHVDVGRGRICFEHLTKLEPELAAPYVLMRTIYADAGRLEDLDNINNLCKQAGAQTKPAVACIEVNNKVQEFVVGQERADTSLKLKSLSSQLIAQGHAPQTDLVLKHLSDDKKEDALCGHAEKLALAFGLLNTSEGTSLVVTKSLRMCNDCHSGTKILSSIEGRGIIVRDAHRVHYFRDGLCSCEDA